MLFVRCSNLHGSDYDLFTIRFLFILTVIVAGAYLPAPYLATTYGQQFPEAVLTQRAAIESKIKSIESEKPTPPAVNTQREWTSKDRKFKTIGVLVESDYRVAKIRKSDGKTVSVSTDKLIDEDRRYIENAFAEVEVFRKNLAKWEKAKQALKSELSTFQEKKDSTANADFALPKSSRIDSQQIPQPGPESQSEKTLAGPIANGMSEYKYVEDDLFPDIYAFHSVAQFRNYSERKRQNPNLTARERNELGIELVESKTRILIISRIPHKSATIFEFEPTTGRNKGKRLFTSSLNVYDSLRDAASQERNESHTIKETSRTPRKRGLGKTDKQLLHLLEEYFRDFESITLADGRPRRMSMASDNMAVFESTGDSNSPDSVTLLIGLPNDAPKDAIFNAALVFIFVKNALPNWSGANDWIISTLGTLNQRRDSKPISKIVDGTEISITILHNLSMCRVTIKSQ